MHFTTSRPYELAFDFYLIYILIARLTKSWGCVSTQCYEAISKDFKVLRRKDKGNGFSGRIVYFFDTHSFHIKIMYMNLMMKLPNDRCFDWGWGWWLG